jgi:hypothetical protein
MSIRFGEEPMRKHRAVSISVMVIVMLATGSLGLEARAQNSQQSRQSQIDAAAAQRTGQLADVKRQRADALARFNADTAKCHQLGVSGQPNTECFERARDRYDRTVKQLNAIETSINRQFGGSPTTGFPINRGFDDQNGTLIQNQQKPQLAPTPRVKVINGVWYQQQRDGTWTPVPR